MTRKPCVEEVFQTFAFAFGICCMCGASTDEPYLVRFKQRVGRVYCFDCIPDDGKKLLAIRALMK